MGLGLLRRATSKIRFHGPAQILEALESVATPSLEAAALREVCMPKAVDTRHARASVAKLGTYSRNHDRFSVALAQWHLWLQATE